MADDNQTPNVGPVARPQPQQPVGRGVPGTKPPPTPSADKIAEIQRQQQQTLAQQRAQAQKMAQQLQANMPADVPTATTSPTAQRIRANAPQNPQGPLSPMQQAQQQATAPSPVPGMAPQQVLAGPKQQQPAMQYQQPGNQFAQFSQPVVQEKPRLAWYPMRSGGIEIELADAIIFGVPDNGIGAEADPGAKVVLALFSEVLYLREQLSFVAQNGGGSAELEQRVGMLERVLHEQSMGMQARARGVKEQIEMFTRQGMSSEDIIAALQEQSTAAEKLAATE